MQIGLIGLGAMGGGMIRRLVGAGHDVVGVDLQEAARARAREHGARTAADPAELLELITGPRVVWVMLPAGEITRATVRRLGEVLQPGDLVVDGGNSDFRDAPGHAAALAEHGVRFADVGVSGGQWGWQNGYGLMVGCEPADHAELAWLWAALGTDGGASRVGGVGAGHLVKAFHNGVQYGVLQAYAEGFALLSAHPEVDRVAAMQAWQGGSSIRSWLLEQIVTALQDNPDLEDVSTRISDSGMGRWTAEEAIRLAVPTPVMTAALHARFASRSDQVGNKLLTAARAQIGGQKS
ncbi:NADP-dependent phosphogluconate dehydrogenase [Nakamurella flavida]|uniref:NADP-dependent phosphogluconate dehydrogenase n=1 Tax=Nakamurella flavida TaxID=363630 RepID=A0A939C1W3_9ACTN|nr:NADP-dependent phosphogluconate dehydrogenase [Nakamurella flavida]MBM9475426.1 NADP-dependent phosphogluconate dehydrogenase [Nakamurella flavida]MBM9475486.1 NADP-dependent phosphogluconate dehydrogenase [Nakamurella flavida]MDP9777006.1 6-phosphogluconate dehydrogenase [Nakamurella flavida]